MTNNFQRNLYYVCTVFPWNIPRGYFISFRFIIIPAVAAAFDDEDLLRIELSDAVTIVNIVIHRELLIFAI